MPPDLTNNDTKFAARFVFKEYDERIMEVTIRMLQKAGVCPLCGGKLKYRDNQEIRCDYIVVPWTCENCGAKGQEESDIVFESHRAVCDIEGQEVDLQQTIDEQFWGEWIAYDGKGMVYRAGLNESCVSIEDACDVIDRYFQNYGDEAIAVWVERRGNGKSSIPIFITCVDVFGDRQVTRNEYL